MAQLYFYYGAMQSSKSANLLMVAHNYRSQDKKVILMTPSIDDRSGVGVISSRAGMEEKAVSLGPEENVYSALKSELIDSKGKRKSFYIIMYII